MMLLLPFLTQRANPTITGTVLNVPTSFVAGAIGSSQINLSWTDPNTSPNEAGFEIQRGLLADYSDAVTINSPAANATSYPNTGLTPETHYYYRLRAKGNGTTTSDSVWVTANATTTALSGDAPLRYKEYVDSGYGYDGWSKFLNGYYGGQFVADYFVSAVSHHTGRSSIRKLRFDGDANLLSEILIFDSLATRLESRRDLAGNTIRGASGEQIGLAFYVQNGVTQFPDPINDSEDQAVGSFLGLGYYRTTDGWATYTDHPNSLPYGINTAYSICGNTIQHPVTGRVWKSAYGTATSQRGILMHSDDYGLTWTLTSLTALINSDSENALALLDPGTGNDDCTIGLFTRNDIDKMDFWGSTDGGASFPFYEQIDHVSTKAKPPICFVRPDNGLLVVLYSDRSAYEYLIWAAEFDMSILKTLVTGVTTTALVTKRILSDSFIHSKPFEPTNITGQFGYPDIAWPVLADGTFDPTASDRAFVAYYDLSPLSPAPWSEREDLCICPTVICAYEGDPQVKVFQKPSFLALPNGTTAVLLEGSIRDNYGAWINGDGATFTAPKSRTYRIAINLPVSSGDGGTKVLNVTKNGSSVVHTITETDGLIGTVGTLRDAFSIALAEGDTLRFTVTVTGSDGTCQMSAGTTALYGVRCGIDIMSLTAMPDPIQVQIQSTSQHFANSVTTEIGGTEILDPLGLWDVTRNMFTFPKTAWYKVTVKQTLPNGPGGRRVFAIHNYENGYFDQDSRVKVHYLTEQKATGGTNQDVQFETYIRGNIGEAMRCLLTVYGADVDSVAGSYNSIEIEEV